MADDRLAGQAGGLQPVVQPAVGEQDDQDQAGGQRRIVPAAEDQASPQVDQHSHQQGDGEDAKPLR